MKFGFYLMISIVIRRKVEIPKFPLDELLDPMTPAAAAGALATSR